ncbi:Uncharacterised protein [Neisseria weaveri]|nr:Uncharacterised protein [Neisseria weaveri]
MNYSLLLALFILLLVVLILMRAKQGGNKAENTKNKPAAKKNHKVQKGEDNSDWAQQVDQSVSDDDGQDWNWGSDANVDSYTTSVSAQEVDPLTEYQVYKQFGYEDKAALSLSGYLNSLTAGAPEKLVHELIGLSLRIGNIDLLADTLDRYGSILSGDGLAEYVKAGLTADSTHLPLRVLAEAKLGWSVEEVARQIGEKTGLEEAESANTVLNIGVDGRSAAPAAEASRNPIVLGKADINSLTEEEMSAVIGFVKPEKGVKLLKNKADYKTALEQYNRAIQKSPKPASLIIDALKLDYQHEEVGQFAKHLWKLYYSLGQYGRQVKERMLGWGYSLGYHEVFDDLEQGPSEQRIREIGLEKGYLSPSSRQVKAKYRDLVKKNLSDGQIDMSPEEAAIKEVEALLMYGQLEQAIGTLEQAVLQYPEESQLYVMLFDLYERGEEWGRLEQFLRLLRERVESLPEEVVLAMSRLLKRVNQQS